MTEVSPASLLNFVIFLSIPFICGYIAKWLKFSTLIGYIIGGLILGVYVSDFSKDIISHFAFFGIIFLLFTVGLEVNFKQIFHLKKFILLGGLLQVGLTIFGVYLLSLLFGFSYLTSLLIGLAFSSSSTILVAKIIQDRGEEGTFLGELALGILMLQDIVFIPLLIIFDSLQNQNLTFTDVSFDIIFGIAKAFVIISILFYIGHKIIPKVFNRLARDSRELLNLFIILFVVGVTFLSTLLQIPVLIGVFMAGILLGQTYEHHHIFSQVRPIRDILAVVFFVFIGMNIDIVSILPMVPKILLFGFLVGLIKMIILVAIFIRLKFHSKTAFSLGILLFQVSENAFILMFSAYHNKIINSQEYLFIISSVLFTLILTPLFLKNREKIYLLIRKIIKKRFVLLEHYINKQIDRDISPIDQLQIKDHIVICGYGRVGQQVGKALLMAHIPFVAVDYNFHIVQKAKEQGINIIYGDPTDYDILDYLEVEHARVLVSAVPDQFSQEMIALHAQRLNSRIIIISRVHKDIDAQRMIDLGVTITIQPEFEASLVIIKKLLYAFNTSQEEIAGHIKRIKMEHGMK